MAEYQLGVAYDKRKNYEDSAKHFGNAVQLLPDNVMYNMLYGVALYKDAIAKAAKEQAKKMGDNVKPESLEESDLDLRAVNLDEAQKYLEAAIKINGDLWYHHYYLGKIDRIQREAAAGRPGVHGRDPGGAPRVGALRGPRRAVPQVGLHRPGHPGRGPGPEEHPRPEPPGHRRVHPRHGLLREEEPRRGDQGLHPVAGGQRWPGAQGAVPARPGLLPPAEYKKAKKDLEQYPRPRARPPSSTSPGRARCSWTSPPSRTRPRPG